MKILKRKNGPATIISSPTANTQNTLTQKIDESRLPLDPTTKRPLTPVAQPGYYPGFSTLAQQAFWDEATRKVVLDAIEAYYATPFVWDEIGFGGPAYPRGYMRLEGGRPEPWEVHEKRYEWEAPPTSLSDIYKQVGGPGGHKSQPSGQEGTH